MQTPIEITQYTVGDNFKSYSNDSFLKLDDPIICFDYGLHAKYNEYYPEDTEPKFEFLGRPIQRMGFKVVDGIINDVKFFLKLQDIDKLYYDLEKVYGKANGARISSRYPQKYGYLTPPELGDSITANAYNDLPNPEVMDYKDLNSISWDDLETKLTNKETYVSLNVRNTQINEQVNHELYIVELEFKVYHHVED